MEGFANVIFPGWIDRPKIETLVESCSGMLAPYRNTENFTRNLPNKIVDSFAMGRPVLSGLDGEVRRWLEDHQVGFFTPDGATLYEVMTRLLNEPGLCTELSRRSRSLYDACFEFEKVYGDLVESLCQLAGSPSSATRQ
jgi:glycosyltransferase involved in cell wall biosynthesis